MSLTTGVHFEPMVITDVFQTMEASKSWYDKVHLATGVGRNLYLSQTLNGNSVSGIVARQATDPEPGNCITVTLKTQATFYQPAPFYTAQNFLIFRHPELDVYSGLVLVTCMRQALKKFSWGYGVSMARLRRTQIMVPATLDSSGLTRADWNEMRKMGTRMVTEASRSMVLKNSDVDARQTPPSLNFAPVLLPDVLDSMGSSKAWFDRSKMTREGDAIYPFVSRTRRANGVDGFFPRQASKDPEPGGAITLGLDTQTLGFQTVPFYTSQNIQVMRHAELDAFTAPVLMTLISAQMGKFSWGGNGATLGRLKRTRIMVPVMCADDGSQKVDWNGIRQYGKWLQARVQAQMRI